MVHWLNRCPDISGYTYPLFVLVIHSFRALLLYTYNPPAYVPHPAAIHEQVKVILYSIHLI